MVHSSELSKNLKKFISFSRIIFELIEGGGEGGGREMRVSLPIKQLDEVFQFFEKIMLRF